MTQYGVKLLLCVALGREHGLEAYCHDGLILLLYISVVVNVEVSSGSVASGK